MGKSDLLTKSIFLAVSSEINYLIIFQRDLKTNPALTINNFSREHV
jgi:hypothetical protein